LRNDWLLHTTEVDHREVIMGKLGAMLATNITTELELKNVIDSPGWWAQQKIDGHRMMALCGPVPILMNRRGEPFAHKIPPLLWEDLQRLPEGLWIDGEFIKGEYIVFDVLIDIRNPSSRHAVVHISPDSPYFRRYEHLRSVLLMASPLKKIKLVKTAHSKDEKKKLLAQLRKDKKEGAIFRASHGLYQVGTRSKNLMKLKFWKSVDVIVYNPGRDNKLSVGVCLFQNDKLRHVGAVTMTQRRLDAVAPGDVIEVKYLYMSEDGRLIQPSFLRIRDDKAPHDCTFDQLQPTDKSVIHS